MVQDNCMSPKFPQTPSLPTEYVCVEVYTVRTGDTLYSISRRYGVSVAMLMEANRILNPYNLRYGQKICIPGHRSDCLKPAHDPCGWEIEAPCPIQEEPITCPEEEIPPMLMPTPQPVPAPAPMPMPAPQPEPAPSPAPMPMPVPAPAPMPIPVPVPVPIPTPMPMPTPVCDGMTHTIRAGDTFYLLAKQHNVL